ncbi:MAG: cyclic nucleotide-binding domain-containing protein [Myxococcota bacterium]
MIELRDIERTGLFVGLSELRRAEALAAFKSFEVGPGEELLVEGENDRGMLVVVDGELIVSLGGVELARIGRGETAGEMTLFGSFDRRSATVSTANSSRLLLLDEEGMKFLRLQDNPLARELETRALRTIARRLRDMDVRIAEKARGEPVEPRKQRGLFSRLATALGVSGDLPSKAPPQALEVLKSTPGFMGRDEEILKALTAKLELVAVPVGEPIVEEGARAEDAFIVAEGKVAVYCSVGEARVERVATLGPGHVFGHVALADTQGRTATCRALEPVYLLRIPGVVYRKYELEQTPEARAFRRGMIDALSIQLRLANEHILNMAGRRR